MNAADFFPMVYAELERAGAKHGLTEWSRHEFYGVLAEEFDELWDTIKRDRPDEELMAELVQVVAVCLRFAESGRRRPDLGADVAHTSPFSGPTPSSPLVYTRPRSDHDRPVDVSFGPNTAVTWTPPLHSR